MQYQYRLKADLEGLMENYYNWGLQYDYAFAVQARNLIRDVAANWTAYEFFYNRTIFFVFLRLKQFWNFRDLDAIYNLFL